MTTLSAAEQQAFALPYEPPLFDAAAAAKSPEQELASRELSRRRLLPFIQRFRPKYTAGWVHADICRRLERFVRQVEAKQEPRLLLMCPPRSGKSEIGSRHLAPWVLGHHPEWEIIAASHTSSLSMSFSRYIRDLLRDPAYTAVFPDAALDPSSQSTENWNLTKGGGYLSAGVGTGITGRGCFTCDTQLQTLTNSDMIRISSVRVGEYVYGYDHKTRIVRPVKVLAVSASRTKRQLIRVEDIVCTDDHEFATSLEGRYTAAGDLTEDLPLVRRNQGQVVKDVPSLLLPEPGEKVNRANLSEVRRGESRTCFGVQGMPHKGVAEGTNSRVEMRPLREEVRAQGPRARSVSTKARSAARLLLQRVLLGASEAKETVARHLRKLRGTVARRTKEVLLPPLLPAGQESFCETVGGIQRRVFGGEEAASYAEGPRVFDVCRKDVPSGGAPHRPQRGEQRSEQLGVVVLSMSQVVSHTHGVCAGQLEDYLQDEDGEVVVDIQTETGNFFIGEGQLLVHNCHILLLDDLVKDIEAADSQTIRDNTWEWYLSTAYTRLAPGGGVIGIMTWWHHDDWAGRIQQAMEAGNGDKFEIVRYPAINEVGDEYILEDDSIVEIPPLSPVPASAQRTRQHNTAIHPERYSTEAMLRIKRNLIAGGQKRVWDALYQQNPLPDEGNYFGKDMFRYYGTAPDRRELYVYQAWDFAISTGQDSDYTVGTCLGQDHRGNLYMLDMRRFKSGDSFVITEVILDFAQQWQVDLLAFEDGQIWKALQAPFERACEDRRYFPSHELLKPLTDKMIRATPLRGHMQQGKVFFDKNAPYFMELQKEMLYFPAGKHDDMVDSLSWTVRLTLSKAAPKQDIKKHTDPPDSWKKRLNGLIGESYVGSHMSA